MSLPINHLKRTLDRCCGQWEFEYAGDDSFRVVFLNTGAQYYAEYTLANHWIASCDSEPADWLQNRLNGLTRDDSGAVAKPVCKDSDEYFGKPLSVYDKPSIGTTDDGWQLLKPGEVIQRGDQIEMEPDLWEDCLSSIIGQVYTEDAARHARIRRRLQPLPADFDCVPEPIHEVPPPQQSIRGIGAMDATHPSPAVQVPPPADHIPDAGKKAADSDGWVEWHGGECPVDADTIVETKWTHNDNITKRAGQIRWHHWDNYPNMTRYRIVDPIGSCVGHSMAPAIEKQYRPFASAEKTLQECLKCLRGFESIGFTLSAEDGVKLSDKIESVLSGVEVRE